MCELAAALHVVNQQLPSSLAADPNKTLVLGRKLHPLGVHRLVEEVALLRVFRLHPRHTLLGPIGTRASLVALKR